TSPIDDPEALGPIVETLMAKARLNSGMNGVPGGPPQPQAGG
ncbi:MAG: short-chain dehydrogenase, partial [Rhodobacteraceae bacterium]|nr:short-chain dehydrogenase [Paracoccaceae bacterium]